MTSIDPWQIMATHTIQYKGEEARVEVVQTLNRAPEFFFFVHFPSKDVLLCRFTANSQLWNGSSLTLEEGKELGEAIEQQIGYKLPEKACNNPFEYKGDIQVKIEKFEIGGLIIERAKAPYTIDIYYRISFSKKKKLVLVRMFFIDDWTWAMESHVNMEGKDFGVFKSMLEHFEEAYQLRIYKPIN